MVILKSWYYPNLLTTQKFRVLDCQDYYPPENLESSVPKFLGTQIFSDAIGCKFISPIESFYISVSK